MLFELGPATHTPVPRLEIILRLGMLTEEPGPDVPVRFGFGRVGRELLRWNMPTERDVVISLRNYVSVRVERVSEPEQHGNAAQKQDDLKLRFQKVSGRNGRLETSTPANYHAEDGQDATLTARFIYTSFISRAAELIPGQSCPASPSVRESGGRTSSPANLAEASSDSPRGERVKPSTVRK